MSWASEIAALRHELTEMIRQVPDRMVGWTLSAASSALGDKDEVQTGDDDQNGPDNKPGQRPVRRIEPWGHRGRAPKNVRTLWLRLGSSNVLFLGIASNGGYGPTDLEDGETALYSVEVERGVHLTKDGDNKLASKSGKTVQVNGSDFSLPKWDDFVSGLSTFLTALKTDMTAANAGTLVGNPAIIAFEAAIATASQYKSTKAKNG